MSPEIEKALAECRQAFASHPEAKSAWCCHHEILWEPLTEPYEKRIAYILSSKPKSEHLLRFQNFRPCTQQTEVEALYADYNAKRDLLYADYNAKRALLYADYNAKLAPLDADYNAKRAPLYADYNAKLAPLYKADVPLGTWNGKSIFA